MNRQARIAVPKASLRLGRRSDRAEARSAERIDVPAIRRLHGGALDDLRTEAERTDLAPPAALGRMLEEPGSPLPTALRAEMEAGFGESFADIRLHRSPSAAESARAMRSAAFAAGEHIGLAADAWQPETAAGKGLIAHELAHASEAAAGRDAGVVRGANIFEQFAGLFKGDTFSDAELTRFVDELTRGEGDLSSTISDNMARAIVNRGLHDRDNHDASIRGTTLAMAADLPVRLRLMRHLLDGFSSNDDQEAVLRILRDASQLEREQLVNTFGVEALLKRFDGARLDELTTLIHGGTNAGGQRVTGTRQSGAQPQDIRWKLNYDIRNAPEIGEDIGGLAIDAFQIQQDGQTDWQTLRRNAVFLEGMAPRQLDMTVSPTPHAKNTGGIAHMMFWVVPTDPALWPIFATATRHSLPQVEFENPEVAREPTDGVRYPAIPAADNQEIVADVSVQLGAIDKGALTQESSRTQTQSQTRRQEDTSATRTTAGASTTIAAESAAENRARQLDRLRAAVGETEGAIRGFEAQQNWRTTVQILRETLLRIEGEIGGETEDTTETEVGVDIHAEIGAEAAAQIAADLGLELGVDLNLSGLGDILGPLTAVVRDPRLKALAAILSLVEGASGGLTLNLSPQGSLGITGGFGGNARARRLWREVNRRNFRLGGAAEQTDSTEVTAEAGGQVTISGQRSRGRSAEAEAAREAEAEATRRRSRRREDVSSRQIEQLDQRVTSLETQTGDSTTTRTTVQSRLFVPVVRDARVRFRVVRDSLGSVVPSAGRRDPVPAAGESGGRSRRRERR